MARAASPWLAYVDDHTIRSGRVLNGVAYQDSEVSDRIREAVHERAPPEEACQDVAEALEAAGFSARGLGVERKKEQKGSRKHTTEADRNHPFARAKGAGFVVVFLLRVLVVCCPFVGCVLAAARPLLPLPGFVALVGSVVRVPRGSPGLRDASPAARGTAWRTKRQEGMRFLRLCVWLCLGLFLARLLPQLLGAQGAAPVLLGSGLRGLGGSLSEARASEALSSCTGASAERAESSGKLSQAGARLRGPFRTRGATSGKRGRREGGRDPDHDDSRLLSGTPFGDSAPRPRLQKPRVGQRRLVFSEVPRWQQEVGRERRG